MLSNLAALAGLILHAAAAPVAYVTRMQKWMVHAVTLPETYAVGVVLLNEGEGALLSASRA